MGLILFVQVERDDELSNLDEHKRRAYFSSTSFAGILICSHHISDTKSTGTLGVLDVAPGDAE